jgi:hypothetical protein
MYASAAHSNDHALEAECSRTVPQLNDTTRRGRAPASNVCGGPRVIRENLSIIIRAIGRRTPLLAGSNREVLSTVVRDAIERAGKPLPDSCSGFTSDIGG